MFKTSWPIEDIKFEGRRNKLIKELKNKGISNNNVLNAIANVPRQLFFPLDFIDHAYKDVAFPIGNGQTISQPYTVALQSSLLQIGEGDTVLEIGTGSGYQAAVLCVLGARVFSIEIHKELALNASKVLNMLDNKPSLFVGDGSKGLEKHAPYKAILLTAGSPTLPLHLLQQVAIGGVIVAPVGEKPTEQEMFCITKTTNNYEVKNYGNCNFVPLTGEKGWKV